MLLHMHSQRRHRAEQTSNVFETLLERKCFTISYVNRRKTLRIANMADVAMFFLENSKIDREGDDMTKIIKFSIDEGIFNGRLTEDLALQASGFGCRQGLDDELV